MKAAPVFRVKYELDDGAILEMVIWGMPQPVLGSAHRFKYRLYYGKGGKRLIGYDNERAKGDHRHFPDNEQSYRFTTPQKLIEDFLADVNSTRAER